MINHNRKRAANPIYYLYYYVPPAKKPRHDNKTRQLFDKAHEWLLESKNVSDAYYRLQHLGSQQLATDLTLPTGQYFQQLAQIFEYYLQTEHTPHREDLRELLAALEDGLIAKGKMGRTISELLLSNMPTFDLPELIDRMMREIVARHLVHDKIRLVNNILAAIPDDAAFLYLPQNRVNLLFEQLLKFVIPTIFSVNKYIPNTRVIAIWDKMFTKLIESSNSNLPYRGSCNSLFQLIFRVAGNYKNDYISLKNWQLLLERTEKHYQIDATKFYQALIMRATFLAPPLVLNIILDAGCKHLTASFFSTLFGRNATISPDNQMVLADHIIEHKLHKKLCQSGNARSMITKLINTTNKKFILAVNCIYSGGLICHPVPTAINELLLVQQNASLQERNLKLWSMDEDFDFNHVHSAVASGSLGKPRHLNRARWVNYVRHIVLFDLLLGDEWQYQEHVPLLPELFKLILTFDSGCRVDEFDRVFFYALSAVIDSEYSKGSSRSLKNCLSIAMYAAFMTNQVATYPDYKKHLKLYQQAEQQQNLDTLQHYKQKIIKGISKLCKKQMGHYDTRQERNTKNNDEHDPNCDRYRAIRYIYNTLD